MSTENFQQFSRLVHDRLAWMSKGDLFTVDIDPDTVWQEYLAAFPPGTNPVYRERTEHDCSCCRQFIKAVGNVISIRDGRPVSIWDVVAPEPYDTVARRLNSVICSAPIAGLFSTQYDEPGTEFNFEQTDRGPHKWHHFHAGRLGKSYSRSPETRSGRAATNVGVIRRAFETITQESVETVLEVIAQGALYRGPEFKKRVQDFHEAQLAYVSLDDYARNNFVWSNHGNSALLIRNSAIGTLLVALSEGKDLEYAVRAYEAITAPIHAIRKAEVEATRNAMARAAEKQELPGILHGKKTEELKLTVEEWLEAKIAAL